MKGAYIRTKGYAEETQNQRYGSPADYAGENIQAATQNAAARTIRHLRVPREKARNNIERAKGHLQEAKQQLPKARRQAAGQAEKPAAKGRDTAGMLRNVADNAGETAEGAKAGARGAGRTLKQVRQDGRKPMREVRQKTWADDRGRPSGVTVPKGEAAKPPADPPGGTFSRPDYLNKGIRTPGDPAGAANASGKPAKGAKAATKGFKDTAKGTVKAAKKSVKTAEHSAKAAVKTAQQTAKAAQKAAQASAKAARAAETAARASARTARAVAHAAMALVKAAIAAIKWLVSAIAAGGWAAVLAILVICMAGLLIGSVYGIFFSGGPGPGAGLTVNSVIAEIDLEYTGRIDAIISSNPHDQLDMSGARAAWKQVLAVYAVLTVSDPDSPMEVATMTDGKAAALRAVFWDMDSISYKLETFDVDEDVLDDDGLPTGETTTATYSVLRVAVSHKAPEEMAVLYGFGGEQKAWLEGLLEPEYNDLWGALLYGATSVGGGSMIEVADAQVGNIGGETYWRWYGYSSRDEWCAMFVSWVAEQCGFIGAGAIPRFASCAVGIQWFKDRGQWRGPGYVPAPGDLVFFDWGRDGVADHVGIVGGVEGGIVKTIEGNSGDAVRRCSYGIDSGSIFGYGVPVYP